MAQPKRHHHVAQHIQKRFADGEGYLYAYDKRRPRGGVFKTTPVNLFVEKDLYTVREKDGSRNTKLESWYSELEGAVTPLLDHIVSSCLAGHLPRLKREETRLWSTFFYHQQKRAPDIFSRLGLEEDFYSDLQGHIANYEREHGPLAEGDRRALESPAALRRILEFARASARAAPGDEVMDVLAARGLAFAITPPNKAFIVGDHPQARRGGSDLSQSDVELWMPIASRIAVSPWGEPGTETLIPVTPGDVRVTNRIIFEGSNIVASRSPALTKSLAGVRS